VFHALFSCMASRILHGRQKQAPHRRYPLHLSFWYIARQREHAIGSGWGETIEIGSSYIRVCPLPFRDLRGIELFMSVTWPATLPDGTPLQLLIQARPVEEAAPLAEVFILNHQFRTAARGPRGLPAALQIWQRNDRNESGDAGKETPEIGEATERSSR
jgi:hypothetical protein